MSLVLEQPVTLHLDLNNPAELIDALVAFKIHFRDKRFAARMFTYEDWSIIQRRCSQYSQPTFTREEWDVIKEPYDEVNTCYPTNANRMKLARTSPSTGYVLY